MNIQEAIRQRHSVRQYTDRPIEPEKLETLRQLIKECNKQGNTHIQLVTNDPKAFDSRLAHYGKFSGVSNYFALVGPDEANLDERLGYYGERLVLEAQMMGLNTCWVGLTYRKTPDAVQVPKGDKFRCVIALGYGANQGVAHKVKTVEKVTKCKGPTPDWFRLGAKCALLAPTAMNQQKFTFTYVRDQVVKATAGWGFFTKVDLGIAMLHFEMGSGRDDIDWNLHIK